jgi:hypothetical protein
MDSIGIDLSYAFIGLSGEFIRLSLHVSRARAD